MHSDERLVIVSEVVREVAADFVSAKFFESSLKVGSSKREEIKCLGHEAGFESNLPKKANALPKG